MIKRCGHCGADFCVNAWREPLSYAEREADAFGRRTLAIIGGDGLLHQCVIDEDKANGRPPMFIAESSRSPLR
jgi:hypothetical protein